MTPQRQRADNLLARKQPGGQLDITARKSPIAVLMNRLRSVAGGALGNVITLSVGVGRGRPPQPYLLIWDSRTNPSVRWVRFGCRSVGRVDVAMELYRSGLLLAKVGERLAVRASTVGRALIEAGVQLRPRYG